MDREPSFINFVRAVFARWFTAMSGPLSVPLAIAALYVTNDLAKALLGITAIVCVVFASYWTWRLERQAVVDTHNHIANLMSQLNVREKRRNIRETLGRFLAEGHELLGRCGDEQQQPPTEDADSWAAKTEEFLAANLGESFIARFRSGAGLPMTATSIASIPHRQLWAGIWVRIARLEEFSVNYSHEA